MKKIIFTIAIVLLISTDLYAANKVVELREYILQELCEGIKVDYKNENSLTIIWHDASEKIIQIAKYKTADSPHIDTLKMSPNDSGWVIEIYRPFDSSKTAKVWPIFFDNKKDKVEMLKEIEDKNLDIGIIIHYGKFANKEDIIEGLRKYKIKAP